MTGNGGTLGPMPSMHESQVARPAAWPSWPDPWLELSADLELVDTHIRDVIRADDPLMSEVSGHLFGAGGKRLRPALVLLAARLGGNCVAPPIALAAGIEVLHTATLLHDDVIDDAATRRHRPSANARWGNSIAMLAGGYLFARAMHVFASAGDTVNGLVCSATEKVWKGQTQETKNAHNLDLDEGTYFEIIERKTAALHELSCRLGGLAAGIPHREAEVVAGYGRDLGTAFQLIDDILDVVSDEETIGKPPAADMRAGIFTLPVIRTLAQQDPAAGRVRAILARRSASEEEIEEALQIVRHNDSIAYTVAATVSILHRAQARLECLPDSEAKQALHRLAQWVLGRPAVARAIAHSGAGAA